MNMYEALIICGRLEIIFNDHEDLLDEVKILERRIIDGDSFYGLITLGRMGELLIDTNLEVEESLKKLEEFFSNEVSTAKLEFPDIDFSDLNSLDMNSSKINHADMEFRNKPIEELKLSTRAYKCLSIAGIHKAGDILNILHDDLKKGIINGQKIHGLGRKTCDEIENLLAEYGYLLD